MYRSTRKTQLTAPHVAVSLAAILSTAPQADTLTVIYDSGHTWPIAPYIDRHTVEKNTDIPSNPLPLPITTTRVTPGKVKPASVSIPYLHPPVFLIGTDPLSKTWLLERRQTLIGLGAVGVLVEAKNKAAVAEINKLCQGLRLIPASADDIAEKLAQQAIPLTHYPVLISNRGIEQ